MYNGVVLNEIAAYYGIPPDEMCESLKVIFGENLGIIRIDVHENPYHVSYSETWNLSGITYR
jgi:hypothetical protein